jgi:hypothetical protein
MGRATDICPVRTINTETVNLRDDVEAQQELLTYVRELHAAKRLRVREAQA